MKYYQWLGQLSSIEFPEPDFDGWWMVEGRPVKGWNRRLIAVYPPDERVDVDFTLVMNGWPVFSSRLSKFLEREAPKLVQFLPFRLQQPDGSGEIRGYCVGQLLRLVDCLDRAQTKVANNWKPVNDFGDFAIRGPIILDNGRIGDEGLFRVRGSSIQVIIRDDLKATVEAAGFAGQRFDAVKVSGLE